MTRWIVPPGWEAPKFLPELRELRLHTIAFVTTLRPSAAVALAARQNPGVRILVITKTEYRRRVEQLGGTWADVDTHASSIKPFGSMYRQSAAGSPTYWRFCHTRWLLLAAELRTNPPPNHGAVAVMDDDVLLFEHVEERLKEAALQKPQAHVEAAINGAYIIASAAALQECASHFESQP